ncbi:MAG TPA: 4-(cytidine 5'-diphospho)-2-C-methyl-D-erythritol kinase, partial [Pyrinomonadaceae bacterium]|nr:4-(cytidine 5'-diphospho)-2-C-methyl-D-erythritol kinase [Pyrinomonadaceae bacterium]
MSLRSFTLPAYAKINWRLNVLGRRADGYHEIRTIFQTVTLHDRLTFAASDDERLFLTCDDETVPSDERNLVVRAALALREKFQVREGAQLHLEKRIPVEAGLGGGSSDAAVALLGLAALWRIKTNREELSRIGARLGADVPFFFTGGTARGTGLGTEIAPLEDAPAVPLLIIKPEARVSTPEAYKALKRPALTKEVADIILSISREEARIRDSLHEVLHNDFERAIY